MSLDAEELYDYVTQEMTGTPAHDSADGYWPVYSSEPTTPSLWDDDSDDWDDDWRDEWDEDDWEDEDDDDWDDDDWDDEDDEWDDDEDEWDDDEDEWDDDLGRPDFFDTRRESF